MPDKNTLTLWIYTCCKPKGLTLFSPMQKNPDFPAHWWIYSFYDLQTAWWLPAETFLFPWPSCAWFSSEVTRPCQRHQELQGWIPWDPWGHVGFQLKLRSRITLNTKRLSTLFYLIQCFQMEGPLSDVTTIPVWRVKSPVLSWQPPPAVCVRGSLHKMRLQKLPTWYQCPGTGQRWWSGGVHHTHMSQLTLWQ